MQGLADTPLLEHSLIAAVIVAAFVLFARAVRSLLGFVGHKIITRTENVLDDRILDVLLACVRPAMVLIGLHIAVREIRKGTVPSDQRLLQILEHAGALLS